jgi:hypothetical protein
MTVIPALGRMSQEDLSLRVAWDTYQDRLPQKRKEQRERMNHRDRK